MKGFFIVFEGIDGAGKTTQARLLAEALIRRGYPVVLTREPGGTPLGEKMRNLLLDPALSGLSPLAEALFYAGARAELVASIIRPALARGRVVISDRYVDSSLAYQGYGRHLDLSELKKINALATGGLTADLTVLLDMPPAAALARLAGRDRIEREEPGFFDRVRRGYLQLVRQEPGRYLVLDGCLDCSELHRRILKAVEERI
ncbi:thymidylate kinase [Desulfofundulus australicus DSM 11792]|uniref:Thymidylate kinase n=1 Tax=Desulfofundulus australicus DSM 11792 TaxID=1121425 RepID=A0A1M4Z8W6_9FIRM|nr:MULTISPECIES: dTMP kinase [Desulfofundulus]MDK2889025.1 dTMP kinase [Thermoanaerobacter sp.]SHF14471.1 thymidylate kinase [Desulfofundulus australicus DSM 11792]